MADPGVLVLPFFKLYINVKRFKEELKKKILLGGRFKREGTSVPVADSH